ncbi:hypothetical protein JCM19235_7143 [Vibrio maritimus]|uniref:Uncharacterized protein n=1 Tax=Vibrio maritimus TaxID=990268 RepID=A0A090S8U9_9VIBR|nr:hypothetical protein JCM19235_7143 [Vibrio maritimus]
MFLNRLRLTRRRWNTVLIVAITFFMLMLSAPTLIKQYLLEPSAHMGQGYVLDPTADPIEINYAGIQFYLQNGVWRAIPEKWDAQASNVIERWRGIRGTPVDAETYQKLRPAFETSMTIEVWYRDIEEPQRVTAYPLNKFWLLSTFDSQWVAVSFDNNQLLPERTQ